MSNSPPIPAKLPTFKGFSFKYPKNESTSTNSSRASNSPVKHSPKPLTNPLNFNSKLDLSFASVGDSELSQKMDLDVKFGQIADIVDFVRWTAPENLRTQKKLFLTAGSLTRSLNLVLYDENGVPTKNSSQSRVNYTQTLDSMDFATKISSVSDAKKGLVAIGHGDGSIDIVKIEDQRLVKKTTIKEKNTSNVKAIVVSDSFIISGTEQGKLFVDGINSTFTKRQATAIESGINALCAYNDYLMLAGTQDGRVILFDLRDRVTNGVINLHNDTEAWKKSFWANRYTDAVKKVDMQNENVVGAGTNEGVVRFADIRNPEGDVERKCRLKTSDFGISELKFSKAGDNKFFASSRSGFVQMDFNSLVSTWFDDHAAKPLYLMDDCYHKIQRQWFTELPNVTCFDLTEGQVVVGNRGGELAFICC